MLYVRKVNCLTRSISAVDRKTNSSWEDLKRRHPLKGPGMPEDIARMAVVLASDDASWASVLGDEGLQ
jgi:NAD(P)-dependent dehydrogenase (short-subunit alcohol dehydrogenase family)